MLQDTKEVAFSVLFDEASAVRIAVMDNDGDRAKPLPVDHGASSGIGMVAVVLPCGDDFCQGVKRRCHF